MNMSRSSLQEAREMTSKYVQAKFTEVLEEKKIKTVKKKKENVNS